MSETRKYIAMYKTLRGDIAAGTIRVGDKLPSDQEMARHFGVSQSTATRAMAMLTEEGILRRTPKRGTFVIARPRKGTRAVGVIADSNGHFHGDFAHVVTEKLLQAGLYPVWVDTGLYNEAVSVPENKTLVQFLQNIIADQPYGFIINGDNYMPFDFIKQQQARMGKIVFVNNYLNSDDIDASFCLIDCRANGRMFAEYFARLGHRRMAYLSMAMPRYIAKYGNGPQELIASGMDEYCRANGLYFDRITTDRFFGGELPVKTLGELKASGRLPDAVATHSDSFCARELYPVCASLHIRIPEDMSVLGYYNTPWCSQLDPDLSSVDLCPAQLAAGCVELLLDPERRERFVSARIVERSSVLCSTSTEQSRNGRKAGGV